MLVRGDRGALVIVTSAAANPAGAIPAGAQRCVPAASRRIGAGFQQASSSKSLTSVEASLRLDAIASAGFGVSRSKMASWIRQGRIRVDWTVMTSPSRELQSGERVQLEGRGELVLDRADRTKQDRGACSSRAADKPSVYGKFLSRQRLAGIPASPKPSGRLAQR